MLVIEIEGKFFLPGGGLNPGESHEEGLKRELCEETGHDIVIGKLIVEAAQYMYSMREQKHFRKMGYFYLCKLGKKIKDPKEVNHRMWWEDPWIAQRMLTQEFQAFAVSRSVSNP
jgi:8-oxo-dGTP diphosphatase